MIVAHCLLCPTPIPYTILQTLDDKLSLAACCQASLVVCIRAPAVGVAVWPGLHVRHLGSYDGILSACTPPCVPRQALRRWRSGVRAVAFPRRTSAGGCGAAGPHCCECAPLPQHCRGDGRERGAAACGAQPGADAQPRCGTCGACRACSTGSGRGWGTCCRGLGPGPGPGEPQAWLHACPFPHCA
jgi:hypothetical protein